MSDKERPTKDNDETENEKIESKVNKNEETKIHSVENKSENEEMRVESSKIKEVAININEETYDINEEVRKKPIKLVVYTLIDRRLQPPPQQPPPQQQGYFWSSPPPTDRPSPLNYKVNTRNDFVRLVLMLVLIMLIATGGFLTFALLNESVNNFFNEISMWIIFLPAIALIMGVNYAFVCSPCARNPPCNFVMLFLTTVGMTLIATKISVHYGTEVVLYAVLATAGIVFVCVGLACTNFDFTRFMLYVLVIAAAFSMVAMIILLVKMVTGIWMKPIVIAILAVSTFIQAVLLVMEIQTVIGGGAVEMTEEDYALGAYMIFTSIINIFLNMVQIIGLSSGN